MTPAQTSTERSLHGGLSHLAALEAESIFIMREVAAEFERPVVLFCGGKDSIILLRIAEKAFRPQKFPFPGHARRHGPQLSGGARLSRPPRRRAGRAPDRRFGPGEHRQRPRPGRAGPRSVAQQAADRDPARRDPGAPVRRRVRRWPARRGEGPRQGAHLLVPRRVRAVGAALAAAGAVEPVQRQDPQGPAHARLPHLQLDGDGRLAVHPAGRPRGPGDLLRPPARRLQAQRHVALDRSVPPSARQRADHQDDRPLPHGRRHDLHRRRRVAAPRRSTRSSSRRPRRGSPSAAPRAPTTHSARQRWKIASARGTSKHGYDNA